MPDEFPLLPEASAETDPFPRMAEKWKLYRSAIEHENNLIHYRLTWFLQSQAFLFAVFGVLFVAWAKNETSGMVPLWIVPAFMILLALYGVYWCVCIFNGVRLALKQLDLLGKDYAEIPKKLSSLVPPLHLWSGRRSWLRVESVPIAAIVVWVALGSVSVRLMLTSIYTPSTKSQSQQVKQK